MKLFLYIQIKGAQQIGFGNPIGNWLKEHQPERVLLEADNHSDDLVIQQEIKMLEEADDLMLWLDALPHEKPGKAVRLIEKVLRNKDINSTIYQSGSNELLERMLKLSGQSVHQVNGTSELKEHISSESN